MESSKQFWGFIKRLKQDSTGVQSLKDGGRLFSDAERKADILNRQFESVFTEEEPLSHLQDPNTFKFPSIPQIDISVAGVAKLLKELDEKKASGPDNISAKILRLAADELAPALTLIFNSSIKTGDLPDDWRTANITPIFKKGDRTTASNYRPVSLTSISCKLLEHIFHRHIMNHLDTHNILTDKQHGFRSKHSCESQLLQTIHDLIHTLDNNKQTDIIIMDFSKAFDTVPHNRLLYKLNKYGINGHIHTWISHFLTKRTQRVVVDGEHSDWAPVRSGVPQGTVLGPLLFLLYINDLPLNISSTVRLFADDCVMYRPITNNNDAKQLQNDLDTLTTWQNNWQMKFNAKKCFVLKISRARVLKQHKYQLSNTTLQETTSHTYLGVEISSDLKWTNHVNSITAKANRVFGFVRRNLHSCPKDLRATAFKSLVRPHLEYCSSVWDPHINELVDKIERIQRRGARFVFKDYRKTSSVTEMLNKLDWIPLQERRRIGRITMLHKISNGQIAIPAGKFLQPVQTRTSSRRNHNKAITRLTGRTEYYNQSFFPHTINEWNKLPSTLVNITDTKSFKEALTGHISQNYN